MEFLTLTGQQDVIAWLKDNATTPNTMVDRIVPRPAEDLPARIQEKTGIADKAPVMGETFIQWVVEDYSTKTMCARRWKKWAWNWWIR